MTEHTKTGFLAWMAAPWKTSWRFRSAILLILALSTGARLFLIAQSTWVNSSDSRDYHQFAESLMRGEGYKQVYDGETSVYHGQTFYAYRMPGYPAVLAIVYSLFGRHPQAVMVLNLLAEIISHLCLLALAFHLFGRAAALWGQGLWGIHLFWTTSLMTESLFTAGFLLLTALLVHGSPFRSKVTAVAYGVLCCSIIFLRPIGVVAYLPLGFLMLGAALPWRSKAVLLLLAALPTALCLSLWAYRNYRLLGQPVFLTSQSGRVNAKEFGIRFEPVYAVMTQQGFNEAQINTRLKKMILDEAGKHPGRFLRIYARRIRGLLVPNPSRDPRLLHLQALFTGPRNSPWVYPLSKRLYYQYHVVCLMAVLGLLIMFWKRARYRELLTVLLCFVLFHSAVSKTYIRYAAPIFPILILFAAYAFGALGSLAGQRREPAGGLDENFNATTPVS